MFFEASAGPPPEEPVFAGFPPWVGPSDEEIGAVLALQRVVARSASVVVVVPTLRVYSTGCMINVEITTRQGDLDLEDWWTLQTASMLSFRGRGSGGRLSDRQLRLGVRFRDGVTVTTLEPPRWRVADGPPPTRVLAYSPQNSGGRVGASTHNFGLWLWPLPPAEPVEFAVEWPIAGIGLTIVEIDGAAVLRAAAESARYWPE